MKRLSHLLLIVSFGIACLPLKQVVAAPLLDQTAPMVANPQPLQLAQLPKEALCSDANMNDSRCWGRTEQEKRAWQNERQNKAYWQQQEQKRAQEQAYWNQQYQERQFVEKQQQDKQFWNNVDKRRARVQRR